MATTWSEFAVATAGALAFVAAGAGLALDRRAGGKGTNAFANLLDATSPTPVVAVLYLAAAIVLLLGHRGGLYLLVPALAAVLIGGVVGAWLILVNLTG